MLLELYPGRVESEAFLRYEAWVILQIRHSAAQWLAAGQYITDTILGIPTILNVNKPDLRPCVTVNFVRLVICDPEARTFSSHEYELKIYASRTVT